MLDLSYATGAHGFRSFATLHHDSRWASATHVPAVPRPMIQLISVMDMRTYPNPAALMDAAAADVLAIAADAIATRGRCLVALSGGATPKGLYERLAARGRAALDWSRVVFLWSDERSVPPDHRDSSARMRRIRAS